MGKKWFLIYELWRCNLVDDEEDPPKRYPDQNMGDQKVELKAETAEEAGVEADRIINHMIDVSETRTECDMPYRYPKNNRVISE